MVSSKTRDRWRLSPLERSWALYDAANSCYALVLMTTVMPVFFKTYSATGMPETEATARWGFANSAASLLLALSAPFLGALADCTNRKREFLAAFMLFGALMTALISGSQQGAWLPALVLYGASLIGFSGANIFYDAMLLDVTKPERMDRLSAIGFAFGYIGSVVPFIGILFLLNWGASRNMGAEMAKLAFVITSVWWLALSLPLLRRMPQASRSDSVSCGGITAALSSLWRTVREILARKEILLFLAAYFFYIDGVDTVIQMAIPYGVDLGLKSGELMIVILVIQLVAFPCALIYGRLTNRFSAKAMILLGIAVYFVIILAGYMLPVLPSYKLKLCAFWGIALLVASSQGGIQALSRSFYAKLIPAERAAEFFGVYNIFGKFAAIMGPFLMAVTIKFSGSSRLGILSLAILFAIGGLILFPLRETKYAERPAS
ncbi:MAG: hypothetical protein A2X49_15320 [Lentisphaerae bacterium GWF2_52_8]|nr:MAG: hypothetical protein A2X49_15320 [Lentisphaerae bacterium GWF2_52_8]